MGVKNLTYWIVLGLLMMVHTMNPSWSENENLLGDSRQLLVTVVPNWNSVNGVMQRYDRETPTDEWIPMGESIAMVVGRNGMAWGRGLHPIPPNAAYEKKEGDGKSPAGVFPISHAFGIESAEKLKTIHIPYLQLTSSIECVDDPTSAHYNQIVDANSVPNDWNSSEKMREYTQLYRLGLVVDHNTNPIEKGCGSCIFIHIWKDRESGTAGCTAMKESDLLKVLYWIDREKNPLLVQLPEEELIQSIRAWGLPEECANLLNGKP